MLGLEHVTSRGSIMIEYYGRDIGVKIMPTGVNPDRFLEEFQRDDTLWRRGELLTQVLCRFHHTTNHTHSKSYIYSIVSTSQLS